MPIYVRDLLRSPLGLDRGTGQRIQGLLFKVAWTPAAAVAAAHFERSGITTPLSGFENNTQSGNTASWVAAYDEISNPIPFNLGAAAPGDVVAKMVITIAADAPPGPVTLTLDPVTALSDQGGFVEETTALGTLALTSGSFTVTSNAAQGLYAAAQSISSILLTWSDPNLAETGFRVERTLDGVAWTTVGTAGPNDTAFLDSAGLSPATMYGYRLVTLLPEDSHASNTAGAMTFPAVAAKVCPTGPLSPPRGWARWPTAVWNGSSWAVAWQGRENAYQDQILFQRFGATDLAPIGSPVAVTASEPGVFAPGMAWNGTQLRPRLVRGADRRAGRAARHDDLLRPARPRRQQAARRPAPHDLRAAAPDRRGAAADARLGRHPLGLLQPRAGSPPMLDLVYRRLDADGDLVTGPVAVASRQRPRLRHRRLVERGDGRVRPRLVRDPRHHQ